MNKAKIIGIDLGATNIRGGIVIDNKLSKITSNRIKSSGTEEEVMQDVFKLVDNIIDDNIESIGIGVPSVVDVKEGIVYDVQYIPSWKEVPLKKRMEDRYKIP